MPFLALFLRNDMRLSGSLSGLFLELRTFSQQEMFQVEGAALAGNVMMGNPLDAVLTPSPEATLAGLQLVGFTFLSAVALLIICRLLKNKKQARSHRVFYKNRDKMY
ncbi:hypothetical protein A6A26_19480 [Pantoea sp. OXWO6B1]|nr:hypothetical protein A6A26_19480 [Pantoea sp. OXWO6B1]